MRQPDAASADRCWIWQPACRYTGFFATAFFAAVFFAPAVFAALGAVLRLAVRAGGSALRARPAKMRENSPIVRDRKATPARCRIGTLAE